MSNWGAVCARASPAQAVAIRVAASALRIQRARMSSGIDSPSTESRWTKNYGVVARGLDVEFEGAREGGGETFRVGCLEVAADAQRAERRIREADLPLVVAVELGNGI